jgi:hypothetical protein
MGQEKTRATKQRQLFFMLIKKVGTAKRTNQPKLPLLNHGIFLMFALLVLLPFVSGAIESSCNDIIKTGATLKIAQ